MRPLIWHEWSHALFRLLPRYISLSTVCLSSSFTLTFHHFPSVVVDKRLIFMSIFIPWERLRLTMSKNKKYYRNCLHYQFELRKHNRCLQIVTVILVRIYLFIQQLRDDTDVLNRVIIVSTTRTISSWETSQATRLQLLLDEKSFSQQFFKFIGCGKGNC